MPAACAAVRADAIWMAMSTASAIGSELDQALIERHALDVLHREVAAPVGGLAELVDVRDVRMAQGGGGARLPLEPREVVRLHRAAMEHLDGDGAVQRPVAGEIDLAHAAAAEQTHDLERSELRVRGEEHSGTALHRPTLALAAVAARRAGCA